MADDGKEMAEGGDASAAGSSDDTKEGEVTAAPNAAAGHLNILSSIELQNSGT